MKKISKNDRNALRMLVVFFAVYVWAAAFAEFGIGWGLAVTGSALGIYIILRIESKNS